VEYYFSRENLCQDSFLVSKMDAAHFVEVSIIAGFKMVKQLTSDHTLILESVKDSDKVPAAPSAARPPALPASLRSAREAAACPRPGTGRAPGKPPRARSTAVIVRLPVGSRAAPGAAPQVVCDAANMKIKPAMVNARTTLILRNISSAASEEAVKALFPADCPKVPPPLRAPTPPPLLGTAPSRRPTGHLAQAAWLTQLRAPRQMVSLRSDVGDNWFASFETEEDTKKALEVARGITWDGKPIGCAIKSENLLKGLQPGSPPKGLAGGNTPGYYVPMQYAANGAPYQYGGYGGAGGDGYRQGSGGRGQGGRRGPGGPGAGGGGAVQGGEDGTSRSRAKGSKKGARARDGGAAGGGGKEAPVQQAPIDLSDFPKLEGSSKKEGGYTKPFQAFTKDEMLAIVKGSAPLEAPHGGEGPFLAHRDTKLESDKHPQANSDAGGDVKRSASAGGAAAKEGGGEKDGTQGAEAPVGKESAPAMNGEASSQPKKLSYAQMAYANGAKKDAAAE